MPRKERGEPKLWYFAIPILVVCLAVVFIYPIKTNN